MAAAAPPPPPETAWCSRARGALDIARGALGAGGRVNSIHPRASGTNSRRRSLHSRAPRRWRRRGPRLSGTLDEETFITAYYDVFTSAEPKQWGVIEPELYVAPQMILIPDEKSNWVLPTVVVCAAVFVVYANI